MPDQTDQDKLLKAIEAMVQIEMIALGQAPALDGKTDADRLLVIANIAQEARRHIRGDGAIDLRDSTVA